MRKVILVLMSLIVSQTSFAGNTEELPDFTHMVDRHSIDIDKDGVDDVAYLIKSDSVQDYLDLWVGLSTETGFYKTAGVTWNSNGSIFGMGAQLETSPQGSLVVHSYNEAVSRSRWDRTVSFTHRNEGLVLAGYTWQERDILNLSNMKCDINLLSKKGDVFGDLFVGEPSDSISAGDLISYKGSFDVKAEDVLSVADSTEEKIYDLYVLDYCYSIVDEIRGDLGERD